MLKRTISSIILIGLTIISIFMLPVWTFSIIASIFIGCGLYEFFSLSPKKILPPGFIWVGMISGIIMPYITYLYRPTGGKWEALFFVIILIALFIIQFTRKDNSDAVTLIAVTLFGVFYVSWFFTFLVKIRFLEEGHKLVSFLLLVTKSGDIGAYLVGSKCGAHKLIPRISPNKSIEGTAAGFVCSIVFALLSKMYLPWMSWGFVVTSGILIGIFGQLGDLAESLIKRDYEVKDSSFFIPGIGGTLDVIDSILFTAPLFYAFLAIVM